MHGLTWRIYVNFQHQLKCILRPPGSHFAVVSLWPQKNWSEGFKLDLDSAHRGRFIWHCFMHTYNVAVNDMITVVGVYTDKHLTDKYLTWNIGWICLDDWNDVLYYLRKTKEKNIRTTFVGHDFSSRNVDWRLCNRRLPNHAKHWRSYEESKSGDHSWPWTCLMPASCTVLPFFWRYV